MVSVGKVCVLIVEVVIYYWVGFVFDWFVYWIGYFGIEEFVYGVVELF